MDVHETEFDEVEWSAARAEERRTALRTNRLGAKAFAEACADGDVERLRAAAQFMCEEAHGGWRLAMLRVARLTSVAAEIQAAFLDAWIESKGLNFRVRDRQALAAALRVLMPAGHVGEPLRLYRGAGARERRTATYGFSWTTQLDIAQNFAKTQLEREGNGVVMETLAPADGIFLACPKLNDDRDEGEVVVDPFRLGRVKVLERLSGTRDARRATNLRSPLPFPDVR